MLIKRTIHHHNKHRMPNRRWRIFTCIMFFPSADSDYIPYQWDMKFVDRSQPLQKALSLHFIIKTTKPTHSGFFMFISVTVQTRQNKYGHTKHPFRYFCLNEELLIRCNNFSSTICDNHARNFASQAVYGCHKGTVNPYNLHLTCLGEDVYIAESNSVGLFHITTKNLLE